MCVSVQATVAQAIAQSLQNKNTMELMPITQPDYNSQTSNNYNYKKRVVKVDNIIMKFLQNNKKLPTFSQQQSNITTTENKRGQNPAIDIPDLHGRQAYSSEVDNDDVLSTSRELQKSVYEKTNRVETILKEDEQHKTRQNSNKENITSNSDTSFFSSQSSTNISQHLSSRNTNRKNNNNQRNNEPQSESSIKCTFQQNLQH